MAVTDGAPRDRGASERLRTGAKPPAEGAAAPGPKARPPSGAGKPPAKPKVVAKSVEVSFAEVDESEFEQASRVIAPKGAPGKSTTGSVRATKPGAPRPAAKAPKSETASAPGATAGARGTGSHKAARSGPHPAVTADAPAPGEPAAEGERPKEKPRIKLILGAGGFLAVLFVCLIILNQAAATSTVEIAMDMVAGDVQVKHETWKEGNPVFDVDSTDKEVVDVKPILYQEDTDQVHFLVFARTDGQADVVVTYNNKDLKIFHVKVEPKAAVKPEWAALKKDQLIERARAAIQVGDDFHRDGLKSLDNYYKAVKNYKLAATMLRTIRFGGSLPEYKDVAAKLDAAQKDLDDLYNKTAYEYEAAVDRELHTKARALLEVLIKILPDENDERYLKNKTLLEYLHP